MKFTLKIKLVIIFVVFLFTLLLSFLLSTYSFSHHTVLNTNSKSNNSNINSNTKRTFNNLRNKKRLRGIGVLNKNHLLDSYTNFETEMAVSKIKMPQLMYGTAWKKERTKELVELAVKNGFRGIIKSLLSHF